MNDEIKISELIGIIWGGKIKIALATIICLVLAFGVLYLTTPTKYESSASVMTDHKDLQSFAQQLKMDKTIQTVLGELKLNADLGKIRRNTFIDSQKESNMATIKIQGENAQEIATIANMLSRQLARNIESYERLKIITEHKKKTVELKNEIIKTEAEIAELNEELAHVSQIITLNKTLTDEQLLSSGNGEQKLKTDELNEEYTNLKSLLNAAKSNNAKLTSEKSNLEEAIKENEQMLSELKEGDDAVIRSSELTSVVIVPAIEPTQALPKNLVPKTIIFGLIGCILMALYLIVKYYIGDVLSVNNRKQDKSMSV